MDKHKIWRIVANNFRALEEHAPDGHVPVVEVFLTGRPEPIRLSKAQTTRDPDFPWTLLISATDGSDDAPSPDDRLIFTPEGYVQRIELTFARSDKRDVGFTHRVLDDPSISDE